MSYPAADVACDFLTYLECRLGMKRDATAEMLGEWLTTYKAERAVQMERQTLRASEPAPS